MHSIFFFFDEINNLKSLPRQIFKFLYLWILVMETFDISNLNDLILQNSKFEIRS